MTIFYQETEKDFFWYRLGWLGLGIMIYFISIFMIFVVTVLTNRFYFFIFIFILIIAVGIYSFIRGFYDNPMTVTDFEIIFSNPRMKKIPIKEVVAVGWFASRREPYQFLIIKTSTKAYIVGRRNSRHVHQTVSDIENLAIAISKITKREIERANYSWISNF